jgi:hypothetical protein
MAPGVRNDRVSTLNGYERGLVALVVSGGRGSGNLIHA